MFAAALIVPATASARAEHAPTPPALRRGRLHHRPAARTRPHAAPARSSDCATSAACLDIRQRPARLAGTTADLAAERSFWLHRLAVVKAEKPLWRTLDRWDDWMCIHGHEGAWNDPNGPYHGGLQMNSGFMAAYGGDLLKRYGTADHWPPAAQVAVAERAYDARGFSPWPNTARACGVL